MIPYLVAEEVRSTLLDFLETTFGFRDAEVRDALFKLLEDPQRGLFKGPYLRLRMPFRTTPAAGSPLKIPLPFDPFVHQLCAYKRLHTVGANDPQPTLVTTGTGSGKTECFLHPLYDHCIRELRAGARPGIKAIILYPMNALAADQAGRMAKERQRLIDAGVPGAERLRVGMYVGGKGSTGTMGPKHIIDKKEALLDTPPDILLTNFKMLDFLLMRPQDNALWTSTGKGILRYLVLDELHTYDGAQGTDVACLIRRLLARTGMTAEDLCPVGTSATLGGGDAEAHLRDFGRRIFGRTFAPDSVITEERLEVDEFLGREICCSAVPDVDDALNPRQDESPTDWFSRQGRLWFPELDDDIGAAPKALGRALAGHAFLRQVLEILGDAPRSLDEILRPFTKAIPEIRDADSPRDDLARLLGSFLSLVSRARAPDGRPFLTVQVQLWFRELRHLSRELTLDGPRFLWREEQRDKVHYLPPVYCRECGASGWVTWKDPASSKIVYNHGQIGQEMLAGSGHLRFLFPAQADRHADHQLNPSTGRITPISAATPVKEGNLPVVLSDDASKPREGTGRKFSRRRCPFCRFDDELTYVASLGASMSSVAISHLYLSGFNTDRKLLAFTDSVQDATHRAAFFGARAFRFNLRTAIQSLVEEAGADGLSLRGVGEKLFALVTRDADTSAGRRRSLATLWPVDLETHPIWDQLFPDGMSTLDDATLTDTDWKEARKGLIRRLGFEAHLEYGLFHRMGRTLETTGSSVASIAPATLDHALERIQVTIAEEFSAGIWGSFDPEKVEHFIRGLLHRLRIRGAIHHPFLVSYAKNRGDRYQLTRRQNPWAPMGLQRGRRPRYLSTEFKPGEHEGFRAETKPKSWTRDWADRMLIGLAPNAVEDLFLRCLRILEEEGVLQSVVVSSTDRAYALDPAALRVTPDPVRMECPGCGASVVVSQDEVEQWEDRACPSYGCGSRLFRATRQVHSYYRRMYGSGRLHRIRSWEHSGILCRRSRERVEDAFKVDPPGAISPNLLVCTPTMEMGIDVGDLSAVMACSVPPRTGNYLQRIGRAGRSTGNSLVLTLAPRSDHSQYFFAEPERMIRGDVEAPGCFLDAPDVLMRQFLAFILDSFTAHTGGEGIRIRSVLMALNSTLSGTGWPMTALGWYAGTADELLNKFLDLFGEDVNHQNRERLREAVRPAILTALVREAFERLKADRDQNKLRVARLRKEIREIEDNPVVVADPETAKRDLTIEARLLARINEEMGKQYLLNFLTHDGLLPNYAFPEEGVRLASRVWGIEDRKTGKRTTRVTEYLRGASTALREFAPGNTFYAEQQKVTVDAVELGRVRETDFSLWRFCRRCDHHERETSETSVSTCPRCGAEDWADQANVQRLLRLRKVMANTNVNDAQILDASEERAQERYSTLDLFTIQSDSYLGGYCIDEIPFGFERLSRVTLREVNFGTSRSETSSEISSRKVPTEGFFICKSCGVVRDAIRTSKVTRHRPYCRHKDETDEAVVWEQVRLYREMTSDALRILLPHVDVDDLVRLHSFVAALRAGLRKKFQGNPVHLRMGVMRAPTSDNQVQPFLVLYDNVPGGTGFLEEIGREEIFHELLQLSFEALAECSCGTPATDASTSIPQVQDGCHRCVLSYETRSWHKSISRRIALEQLRQILDKWAELHPIASLAEVPVERAEQSILEVRFVGALKDVEDVEVTDTMQTGKLAYHIKLNTGDEPPTRTWLMVPQQDLNSEHAFHLPNRPDFVLTELSESSGGAGQRRVAVFTDGYHYHVCPTKDHAILHRDAVIRGDYHNWDRAAVFSVTWKDIDALQRGSETTRGISAFPLDRRFKAGNPWSLLKKQYPECQVPPETTPRLNSMRLLVEYLRHPDKKVWSRVGALSVLLSHPLKRGTREEWTETLQEMTDGGPEPIEAIYAGLSGEMLLGTVVENGPLQFLVLAEATAKHTLDPELIRVVGILDDTAELRADKDSYETPWRKWLHAANLLQWLPGFFFGVTSDPEGIRGAMESRDLPALDVPVVGDEVLLAAEPRTPWLTETRRADSGSSDSLFPESPPLRRLLETFRADARETFQSLRLTCHESRRATLPTPDPSELTDRSGRVVLECELSWPVPGIYVLTDDEEQLLREADALPPAGHWFPTRDLTDRNDEIIDALLTGTSTEETR